MVRRFLGLVSLAFLLQGCAAVGLALVGAGAGAGVSAGVEHTLNGIAYKTFPASVQDMRFATVKTLDRLRMSVKEDAQTADGWNLTADAADRTIDIGLERVTDDVTRMRVVVNEGKIFFKDSSTATEIILQTAKTVDSIIASAQATPVRTNNKRTSKSKGSS